MKEQDMNRILVKLDEMDRYLRELGEILPEEDEYHRDLIKRRACEKTIELAYHRSPGREQGNNPGYGRKDKRYEGVQEHPGP